MTTKVGSMLVNVVVNSIEYHQTSLWDPLSGIALPRKARNVFRVDDPVGYQGILAAMKLSTFWRGGSLLLQ